MIIASLILLGIVGYSVLWLSGTISQEEEKQMTKEMTKEATND